MGLGKRSSLSAEWVCKSVGSLQVENEEGHGYILLLHLFDSLHLTTLYRIKHSALFPRMIGFPEAGSRSPVELRTVIKRKKEKNGSVYSTRFTACTHSLTR